MARTVSKRSSAPAGKGPYQKQPTPTRGGPQDGPRPVDVVGCAKDQCYKYEVKSGRIKGNCRGDVTGIGTSCVEFSGAAVEDGSAVFVLCCRKEHGKCTECHETVTLEVIDTSNTRIAFKEVTVTCRPTS